MILPFLSKDEVLIFFSLLPILYSASLCHLHPLHSLLLSCFVISPFSLVFALGGDCMCTDWEVMNVISKIIQV